MNKNIISGYEILSISIIQSNFTREKEYDKADPVELSVKILVDKDIIDTIAKCTLTVMCQVLDATHDKVIAKGEVTSYGVFEMTEDDLPLPIEHFAKLNAMAIMYPYVREHLSTLSIKAGMNMIIIPSVNFVKFSKEQEQEESLND